MKQQAVYSLKMLNRKLILSFIFYGWLLTILLFTVISFSENSLIGKQNNLGFRIDYLEHFFLYTTIPVLFILAEKAYLDRLIRNKVHLIIAGLLFCVSTEVLQIFVPDRTFNPIDLGLNLGGFITGLLSGKILYNILLKNNA